MKEVVTAFRNHSRFGPAQEAAIGYVIEEVPSLLSIFMTAVLDRRYPGRTTHRLEVIVDGALELHYNTPVKGRRSEKKLLQAHKKIDRYARMRASNVTHFEKSKPELILLGVDVT